MPKLLGDQRPKYSTTKGTKYFHQVVQQLHNDNPYQLHHAQQQLMQK